MAISVKFYLKRPDSDKETVIYFLMNYGAYTVLPSGKKNLKSADNFSSVRFSPCL